MVQCPECHKQQEADFGMVTCGSCGCVFMVEFDGSVNQPEDVGVGEELLPSQDEQIEDQALLDANGEAGPGADTYDENFLEPQPEEVRPEEVEPVALEQNISDAKDPLGLQKFEEAGGTSLSDGEYLYDILIAGIDSGEIKKELFLALSDKRFSLIMDDLRSKVQGGQLLIEGLNPVRAMLIVLKIQEMDVQIEWRQKHFTQGLMGRESEVEP